MIEEKKYGVATVGVGTSEKREIPIEEYVKSLYKDNRLVSIVKLEDGSFILSIENPGSSGRATQTSMWLSRESFISLISTSFLYFGCAGENFGELLQECVTKDCLDYDFSDNLKPLDLEKQKENSEEQKENFKNNER